MRTIEAATRGPLALAGLNGFLAVAAGAFGAHGVHDPAVRDLLHTGAQYQMVHAAAALAVASFGGRLAAWLFGAGALLFGASLYLLAFSGAKPWGAVTPVGGLLLLAGWATVGWSALRPRS